MGSADLLSSQNSTKGVFYSLKSENCFLFHLHFIRLAFLICFINLFASELFANMAIQYVFKYCTVNYRTP